MIRPILFSLITLIAVQNTYAASKSTASPEIDKETTAEMQKRRPEIVECHKHFLDEGTDEKGVVVLKWKINDEGKVVDAEVDTKQSTLKNKVLSDCLLDMVKSVTFTPAEPEKTKTSFYRFTFQ